MGLRARYRSTTRCYLLPMKSMQRPELEEVPPFYRGYILQAEGSDLFQALENASGRLHEALDMLSAETANHRYAPHKWSIKELLQHVVDTERIMAYRALCFARADSTPLPGFDENTYAANAAVGHRSLQELLAEHDAVRLSTIALFRGFSPEALLRIGIANERSFTVRALGWTIAGHSLHHLHVLKERYLVQAQ